VLAAANAVSEPLRSIDEGGGESGAAADAVHGDGRDRDAGVAPVICTVRLVVIGSAGPPTRCGCRAGAPG
jgi:hypothetical protein